MIQNIKNTFLFLLMLVLFSSGMPLHGAINRIPSSGYVMCDDGTLSVGTVASLNEALRNLQNSTGIEAMVIVKKHTKRNLEPREYAYELFKEIGLGTAESNNGVLILLVLDKREVVFEVGYGLEGLLTDYYCKQLQMEYMVPSFQNDFWDLGLHTGIEKLISDLSNPEWHGEFQMGSSPQAEEKYLGIMPSITHLFIVGIFLLLVNYLVVFMVQRRLKKKNLLKAEVMNLFILTKRFKPSLKLALLYIPITPAAVYLLFWLNHRVLKGMKITCPFCKYGTMKPQRGYNIGREIDKGTAAEIALGTTYVDAYACTSCRKTKLFTVKMPTESIDQCPNCSYITLQMVSSFKVVKRATASSKTGLMMAKFTCKSCGKEYTSSKTYQYTPPSSSGGSGSSRSGSSSSGSSSSSRGSSGGGGASSRF